MARERATELEYFTRFRIHADFGPTEGDVVDELNKRFIQMTGKNLPEGWNISSDGNRNLDQSES